MKKLMYFLIFVLLSSAVFATGEITQLADRLNYWTDGETHTVSVTNSGPLTTLVNVTIPTGFVYDSGTCPEAGGVITCNLTANQTKYYVVNSSGTLSEYTLSTFSPVADNSYTGNDVQFIKIKDDEIAHTLVEYGRGRGNYFFDTYGSGLAGSGHTGTGCAYVPNGTMFELNFLHKINNVKQYYGDLTAKAYNATFDCTYPNSTIVREHLITAIVTNSTGAFLSYRIPKIEGSWERMGYLGMDFEEDEYALGSSITVNCTNITYLFPLGGGYFVVDEDSFSLQVRNREPFVATAATATTIGNGTQEVIITYNITNTELYTVDDVVIEIQAPPYATFIGVQGELWGAALDQYRIEKAQLAPGESEIVRLVARFDTSNAPAMSSVELADGIKIEYTTCWEINAYNPGEYVQTVTSVGNGTVNMGVPSTIIGVINRLTIIRNITTVINTTVVDISHTVNNISVIVDVINLTTQDTNIIVKEINSTSYVILNKSQILLNNTIVILNDTQFIIDQLNCNTTIDSPICDKMNLINHSLHQLYNFSVLLNYTASNLNITVIENINTSGVNVSVNVDLTNLTSRLREVKTFINCTNASAQPNGSACNRLARIENYTALVNNTVNSIYNLTTYFNTSVFGNLTFQQIVDAIDNITIDTSDVLQALQELREFDEEIVFLITDSFGLQQSAKDSFLKGDVGTAFNDLFEANENLKEATDRIIVEAGEQGDFSTKWVWVGLVGIAAAAIFVYLFGKAPPDKSGKASLGFLRLLLLMVFLLLCVNFVSAQWGPLGTIVQEAGALNFGDEFKNQTVFIYYNCTGSRVFNVTLPTGFSLEQTSTGCGLIGNQVSCSMNDVFAGDNYGWYKIRAIANFTDHEIIDFPTSLSNTTNCSVANNISFLKIPDDEVFQTLVEYGRGRGNYFYSTRGGRAGSGHTGTGCTYVPNGTIFELNFLHKIFNIKQYYNDANAIATNATFKCSYPNRTIVRSHLGANISRDSSGTNITYVIDEIKGDWERMGYVGMQFDTTEQSVGENLTISCYNVSYYLETQTGFITVYQNGISFDLQVRNPYPFTVAASTTSTVGNGTQEVIITYNITNTELYTVDDVIIEIQAPPYAEFIGTRGELWGAALDQYRIEKISLAPGESEILQLVARFDTSNAPAASTIDLSNGVKIKYVTCWDLNAYNPAESLQILTGIGTTGLNMSVPTEVINIRETIEEIYDLVTVINETTIVINGTVNNIETIVIEINSTTMDTNTIVKEINTTVNNILGNVSLALINTNSIIVDTSYIKDLLNCNGTIDTPLCSGLDAINNTINNITSVLVDVNKTLHNITINITIDLAGENIFVNVTPDLTNITLIVDDIFAELNCSMNWTTEPEESICKRLDRIENTTVVINNTVENINDLILYFNATVFGNVTLQEIYDKITNITLDTSDLLTEIRRMREFDEELVFLVTDAFGLQDSARKDLDNGNLGGATAKLREANEKLAEASTRLMTIRNETALEESNYTWVLTTAASFMVILALGLFLFSKPKG